MFLKNCQQNSVALTTNHETQKIVEMQCNALDSPIALCHQPCHGGFTIKITDSPNMVARSTCHGRFTEEITGSPNNS